MADLGNLEIRIKDSIRNNGNREITGQVLQERLLEMLAEIGKKQDTLQSGQNIKTINNQSIIGEGNIEIKADIDTITLATKEELTTLQNEVIMNEEVIAAAINELNTRIGAAADTAYVDNAIASAITSTLNTEV